MTWSGWGGPTATASGQLWQKSCVPNCATGNVYPYPATVIVSRLGHGSYGSIHIDAPDSPNPSQDFELGSRGPGPMPQG
ncbi:hypothetical protein ACFWXO_18705 [Kitasatospora sp. NPDC059088]|uniref:hypothetical protein n=1 Tax=Kitasatospora sp. NPDC059088 TaxID=3346722 RepID=UPI0036AF48D3